MTRRPLPMRRLRLRSSTRRASRADPTRHATNSDVVIAVHFAKKLVLIGGTSYAGEMKKSVFSISQLHPPAAERPVDALLGERRPCRRRRAVLRSLRHGKDDALERSRSRLIGDDEHGWSDRGHLQFRRRLLREDDPTVGRRRAADLRDDPRFGTVLENVVVDPETRELNLDDDRYTENTRAAYPIAFIDNAVASGQAGHPKNVVMLTADAFGVLPPISRLSPEAAMYHFLSGYTAKVAGTEKGVHRAEGDLQQPASARRSCRWRRAAMRGCSARRSRATTRGCGS